MQRQLTVTQSHGLRAPCRYDVEDMAIPAGLEPATPCLEGRCSIQLSYGIILWVRQYTSDPLVQTTIGQGC